MSLAEVGSMGQNIRVSRAGVLLLPSCYNASTWQQRARGLIGRPKELAAGGLLLYPCSSIHNFFMSYAIDAVFLDSSGRIIKVTRDFRPWHPYAGAFKAIATLELLAGKAGELELKVGDVLTFNPAT